ncbi:MAG: prepilin-type N-terminal cleavage/methylation domain-containing protein [Prevotella sp.]|nr:prepilin-type N-terminal cleavage/methylation domain-containing protein [Alistipes senegalensis]MCM1357516.1 prepilin-type N-terminal cleavage/methylation domain-containing protein [Prevotella sp.]MCM1473554.1 prepilin-type N-terminal cleavage/methylation domain-containing protein [Muribaculaceae bacterium]
MKNKKNLKGFTLVELIVVMAVFGIIMLGAMQFLSPVSRMMKGASLQESNSATVDNIKRYFESTLRYASAVYVHNGDLKKYHEVTGDAVVLGGTEEARQTQAVKKFVNDYFKDKADSHNDPIKGEVHLMKIDNDNGGKITESLFSFEAGYTYYNWNGTDAWDSSDIEPASVNLTSFDQPVINDVYYKDYSIFATLGYNTVNAIQAGDVSALPAKVREDQYFGRINPVEIDDGTGTLVPYTFGPNMFSFSFVTYKNDTDGSGNSLYHHIVDGQHVFGSPYSSSNATLALVNMKSGFCDGYNTSLNNRPIRRNGNGYTPTTPVDEFTGGNPPTYVPDGKWDYEPLQTTPNSFTVYDPNNSAGGNNIYIIYTLPD